MNEGWGWLMNSRKWHYFVEKKSLCGKWAIFKDDDLEQGDDGSPDNCVACKRKLKSRQERENV
jgi:hypothetical protein